MLFPIPASTARYLTQCRYTAGKQRRVNPSAAALSSGGRAVQAGNCCCPVAVLGTIILKS
jgi:hypothetical protein